MNPDKAYLFGLIIGGGVISRRYDNLTINLPYRNWGKIIINPTRAGQIATDILTRIRPIFQNEYGITVTFTPEPEWRITCHGNLHRLIADFRRFGIRCAGELRKITDISGIIPFLVDDNHKRQFIAGLADAIGSLAPTHRRFNNDYQIISFEFNGNNYQLVYQICRILSDINCHADQILWNHPNQHSTDNPYYRSWKKGFKLRVLLDQYTAQGSFFFQAKQEGAKQNIRLQTSETHNAAPCETRTINVTPSTVHMAENDIWLPENIRGYHFIHHKHICAVMGCPRAPVGILLPYLQRAEYYINPFPIIFRGLLLEVNDIIRRESLMANRQYRETRVTIRELLNTYHTFPDSLIWGNEQDESGYPISEVLQAIAYVSSGVRGNLFGTRIRGNFLNEIEVAIRDDIIRNIRILIPDRLTPIVIKCRNYASLVGPQNPSVYRKLIIREDPLRFRVRAIREEDL